MLSHSSPELEMLDASVSDFCARELDIKRLRDLRAENLAFDREAWSKMCELGWPSVLIREDLGGLDMGESAVAQICRGLGRVLAPEPFVECGIACASLLQSVDNAGQRLKELTAGERIYVCPLNFAQWDSAPLAATGDPSSGYLLSGLLEHLCLADAADRVLVPAKLAGSTVVFDLELDRKNLTVTTSQLADGTQACDLRFSQVHCKPSEYIGAATGADVTHVMRTTGLAASAYLLGACESLLDLTIEYMRTREQFKQPIGSFQALQHRAVDLYLQIRLCAASLESIVVGVESADSRADAARVRQRACDAAMACIREAIQIHGAIGYTEQSDVALYVWRVLALTARFGGGRREIIAAAESLSIEPELAKEVSEQDDDATMTSAPDSDWNLLSDNQFRRLVRKWVGENYPANLRHLPYQLRWSEIRAWHAALVTRGWAAPAWPREHGGMGLAPSKLIIFIEELERHGVARAPDQGIVMVGPILFEYGSQAQRDRYLESALNGEHIWCQGYSEPNAGSDLASLKTRAIIDGDEFVVTGQKTWTTHGLDATHMYCLVRTDVEVKPQAGISFLLIDLDQPGIDIRPIPNLGGHVDFCEVFLDQVRVPKENLVGGLNQGWTIAKALLGHERLFVGSPKLCQHALNQLRSLARSRGRMRDPVFVDALCQATLDVLDLEALYAQFAELTKAGKDLGADIALLKIWSTETYTRLSELMFQLAGESAAIIGGDGESGVDPLGHYYSARPAPIYAGSNEIQRNIIAKHVLRLPS